MTPYTPTTEEVRTDYVVAYTNAESSQLLAGMAFDRWLAQHDAEVRTAALNAAADALPESTPPLGGPLAISPAVHARVQEWLRAQAGEMA